MLLFIRYTKGLGDSAIYTRLRDATGQYWDFTASAWSATLTTNCKAFLSESLIVDPDATDALYSTTKTIPAGGPWIEETVLDSTNKVLGYDNTTGNVDSATLNLQQSLFGYVGHASNVFSIVQGSFTGTIDFYATSFTNWAANPGNPTGTRVCTLSSTGVMSNVTNIATSGDVLYFKLPATFTCLADLVVNVYAYANKGNVRIYVPLGVQTITADYVYYPTVSSGLLVYEGGNLISFGETAYGKSLAMIPGINWDLISQPVQLTTTAVVV